MIYLDNSATTALCNAAKEKIIESLEMYGNPSSRHALGVTSSRALEEARVNVALALGLKRTDSQRVIFTSCGSESNNLALLGCAYAKEKRRANKIICTDSEHPSVENVMSRLEKDGFEVIRISTRGGIFDFDAFKEHMDDKVMLVSVMRVNNETGAVYDTKKIFEYAKSVNPQVVTHCDAVQGFLKVDCNPQKMSADLMSISAHKVHGPKGVGALYVSQETIKTKKIIPHLIGGGQESGLRSGTENVIGILGFSAAVQTGFENYSENRKKLLSLRGLCEEKVREAGAEINMPQGERAPHIISVKLPYIKSETMLNFLSGKGICVSSGSACSSHSNHISSSLVGFGLEKAEADSTIRVSLCEYNTEEEIEFFAHTLSDGIKFLIKFKR